MGLSKNHFKTVFAKLNISQNRGGASISINLERFGHKVDIAQDAVDAQVWNDMQRYMPRDTGEFIAETNILNQSTRGEVYKYPPSSDRGHYLYEGIKYVDPEYDKGAFYNPDFGFWSRPGVKKVPSAEPLFYSNPSAEAHWDEVAAQNHMKQWVQVAKTPFK